MLTTQKCYYFCLTAAERQQPCAGTDWYEKIKGCQRRAKRSLRSNQKHLLIWNKLARSLVWLDVYDWEPPSEWVFAACCRCKQQWCAHPFLSSLIKHGLSTHQRSMVCYKSKPYFTLTCNGMLVGTNVSYETYFLLSTDWMLYCELVYFIFSVLRMKTKNFVELKLKVYSSKDKSSRQHSISEILRIFSLEWHQADAALFKICT